MAGVDEQHIILAQFGERLQPYILHFMLKDSSSRYRLQRFKGVRLGSASILTIFAANTTGGVNSRSVANTPICPWIFLGCGITPGWKRVVASCAWYCGGRIYVDCLRNSSQGGENRDAKAVTEWIIFQR
jgi:hypothetical protein